MARILYMKTICVIKTNNNVRISFFFYFTFYEAMQIVTLYTNNYQKDEHHYNSKLSSLRNSFV